ncbi:methylenetetrahydrofolate--tRNA-(uracil(54)-C(5))-methyltransferase (FADH(2)-oxidizing) TrmFO [Acholeplasma sp. OttesenSCG-928-E16]|nr:methylenetetrahydrofolate--tRNA-(uracil(54)-C(5))-methyltransferase (FADH(2)-oxidizing) TrmFO [Acholeplasma sp. OttesenSCG-928-E16]
MVKIIGAGLAGCEAAWYLANKGIKIKLYEMRTKKNTPAHQTGDFAELVCSNSLRSEDINNAAGLIKEELKMFNSLIMEAAYLNRVKAGSSLAVDRNGFSKYITNKIKNHPNIEFINDEVTKIDTDEYTIIAAGPLVSDELFISIKELFGMDYLHFFDAVAPIVDASSINYQIAYLKSRYDKGEAAYLNCPMTKEEYTIFYNELINAKVVKQKDFENNIFEGCMPVEVMAKRGFETLTYGPLKPVGLEIDDNKPYAIVQLRQDDFSASMYNIVGFQTHLTFKEQLRVIRLIPGLENAKIIRYGVMHRNSYIESPKLLNNGYQVIKYPKIFVAGQLSGVEGYIESTGSGLVAAINMYEYQKKGFIKPLPKETMLGAMANFIGTPNNNFVPMNANFGLIPELSFKHKKKERKELYSKRALKKLNEYKEALL